MKLRADGTDAQVQGHMLLKTVASGGQRVEESRLALFAVHRSFSASAFLAKNSLDFTVPTGTLSIWAASSSV